MSDEVWDFILDSVEVNPSQEGKTLITTFEGGGEQRRQKNVVFKEAFELSYSQVLAAQLKDMQNFHRDRKGAFDTFLFEHLLDSPIKNSEVVSTTLGSTQFFNLLRQNIFEDTEEILIDGVTQVRDVDYTIDNALGQLFFGITPAGTTMTAIDYQFHHRVRFGSDQLQSKSLFRQDNVYSVKITFVTVPDES